jgi:hypothetical protein
VRRKLVMLAIQVRSSPPFTNSFQVGQPSDWGCMPPAMACSGIPYHQPVRYSPSISSGEAGITNSSARANCSGSVFHSGSQPVRSERHMQKRKIGYSIRCCSRRASAGANTCSTFIEERLAWMLVAYMTFEIATYTQNALRSHRKLRNPGTSLFAAATRSRGLPATEASAGAMRSSGEALMEWLGGPVVGGAHRRPHRNASLRRSAPPVRPAATPWGRARWRRGRARGLWVRGGR